MKKKLFLLTLNDYIIYQPTILNLYDYLSPHFDVEVVSFQPYHVTKKKDEKRKITYLSTSYWGSQFYGKIDFVFSKFTETIKKVFPSYKYHYTYYNRYLPSILRKYAKRNISSEDVVIAVDLQALYLAQSLFGSVHFVSLEIDDRTNPLYKKLDHSRIKSVLIQSPERFEYIFPGKDQRVFYVQNAPSYDGITYPIEGRKDFIWAGAIDKRLAIIECLGFFKRYPEYRMILKGGGNRKILQRIRAEYSELIEQERIVINQEYLPAEKFLQFLSKFKIGFSFYEWSLIRDNFNYESAPSGKLFMYFAAGTPVIASDILGFDLVKKFNAGVLVDNYEPETILNAVREIERNYEMYSKGCYAAAEHFSFEKNVRPYVRFLIDTELNQVNP